MAVADIKKIYSEPDEFFVLKLLHGQKKCVWSSTMPSSLVHIRSTL